MITTTCPHGDPYCPCQDGDPCHYEWAGDTPPMDCVHCMTAPIRGHENDMVWSWHRGATSGVTLTIDTVVSALQRHGHAIITTPEYQRLRAMRRPAESFRFCDARFIECRR